MQHVGGEREAGGMPVQHGLVEDVFHQHRLAEAIRADQDDIGGFADEAEGEDFLDERPIALGGPRPVEVGDWLEDADACILEPPLEAAPCSLSLLDGEQLREPGFVDDGLGVGKQPVEAEALQALA
jgi:hypothetical protein